MIYWIKWGDENISTSEFLFYKNETNASSVSTEVLMAWAQLSLTHPPLYKMAAIPQTIFSDAFSWKKSFFFCFFLLEFYIYFTEVCA